MILENQADIYNIVFCSSNENKYKGEGLFVSIISTASSWKNQTAYQLAKSHISSKISQSETSTVSDSEKPKEDTTVEEKQEKQEGAINADNTDVFLSSSKEQEENLFSVSLGLSASQSAKDSSNFQIKSSAPDDSVGQLAAMLARAETKLDVQQVSGKAMRALVNLRASAANASDEDAKKIAAKIRRMEKLMKRIEKKLKHLGKEEQLEIERKRAVEKEQKQKAGQIEDELKTRRKKRRRDEKNYAEKEIAEDQKEASSDILAAFGGANSASLPGSTSVSGGDVVSGMDAVSGTDFSAGAMDAGSLDITV